MVYAYCLINLVNTIAYAYGYNRILFLVALYFVHKLAVLLTHVLYLYPVHLSKP